jgi:hypothetical protein
VGTGTAVTLSASLPAGTGNVTCAWYVNGVATAVGATYSTNGSASALTPGTYRIDVTVFTSDGLRAGSATTIMTVVNVAPVSLAWDANTETTLAGYKLYVGTASGVYGAPTTLGLVTTTTVPNLMSGTTYYFTLTAFNTSGQESLKSAELSYKVP